MNKSHKGPTTIILRRYASRNEFNLK